MAGQDNTNRKKQIGTPITRKEAVALAYKALDDIERQRRETLRVEAAKFADMFENEDK